MNGARTTLTRAEPLPGGGDELDLAGDLALDRIEALAKVGGCAS
jgi:hypothetical protein